MFPVVVIPQREVNRSKGTQRPDQFCKRRVIVRQTKLVSEVAIYNESGWFYRPRREFAGAGSQVVRHVHAVVLHRCVSGDVRIREKGEGMFVPGFAKQTGVAARDCCQAGSSQRGTLEKFAA